ncbi:MAG: dTDP-Rha--alpha-D-GlcNAc-pyrophosphate polyprenol alpha-3-L-rhamnosyltransferase [Bacteroidetes bacterium]|nr:MAG: dTDP-Rha--alpha-D-GlcNAc-pyrophosphate polyprenol alpha-3-L-rhamnosyltransferase [Bacteroidota bacterium]
MKTIVAILNWNGIEHLKTYLPSVVEFSKINIYVIDNGSTDDSVSWINVTYPEIEIIQLPQNLGFAGGYNAGLSNISADRFILLNSDVRVTEGWVESVNKSMNDNNWSACAPIILDDKNPEYYEYAGAAGGFIDKDGFMFCAGRVFDSIEKVNGHYKTDEEVFWASGAALFVDSKVWDEVEGLDSDLFAHMEEIDFCWRLKNRGYKIGACRNAYVYHYGGGTLTTSSPRKVFLNFRNNLVIILKNQTGYPLLFIYRRLLLDGVAALRFLLRGELIFFLSVVKAHLAFYRMIPSTIKKRQLELIARETNIANRTGMYKKSILIEYFLNKAKSISDLSFNDFE